LSLVSSSVVSGDASEPAVRAHLARLYGVDTARWEHVAAYDVRDALPVQGPPMGRFRKAVRLEPGLYVCGDHRDSASIQGALVSALRMAERLDEAAGVLAHALELAPATAPLHAEHGELLRRLGRSQESLLALERALELEPDNAWALGTRGQVLADLDRTEEAIRDFRRAVEVGPPLHWVHAELGSALLKTGHAEDAVGAFRRAMTLAPRDFAAYVALAQLLGKRGDTKGALAVLAPIADASKKDPPLANALGMAYAGARDFASAEGSFRTALAVDPDFAEARLNLADTLVAQGRYPDAVSEYQKLLKNEPTREDVRPSAVRIRG
jgi:Flp pilus assembly protein TadD